MKELLVKVADALFGRPKLAPEPEKKQVEELDRRVTERWEEIKAEARGWVRKYGSD